MNIRTTFGEWRRIAPFTDFQMQEFSRPEKVGGKATPETLNDITLGQLLELSMTTEDDVFHKICEVLLGLKPAETDKARAVDVVRFCGWVMSEVNKINALFDKVDSKPSQQELRAGVRKLNFGIFGLIDWYALRMGYHDHAEVESVPWVRVYKCMDMDNQRNQYQRRLQEIIYNDNRRNH